MAESLVANMMSLTMSPGATGEVNIKKKKEYSKDNSISSLNSSKEEGDEPDTPFVAPSEDLIAKIVSQCEFYFSDVNLPKDNFLLSRIRHDEDGWVKLQLVASFKKLQSMSTDVRVIRHALGLSTQLQLSDDGNRLRRRNPLPAWDESVYSRSVVVSGFPKDQEKVDIVQIEALFNELVGSVGLVKTVRPRHPLASYLRRCQRFNRELGRKLCAIVEFKTAEAAQQAVLASAQGRTHYKVVGLHTAPRLSNPKPGEEAPTSPDDKADKKQSKKKKSPPREEVKLTVNSRAAGLRGEDTPTTENGSWAAKTKKSVRTENWTKPKETHDGAVGDVLEKKKNGNGLGEQEEVVERKRLFRTNGNGEETGPRLVLIRKCRGPKDVGDKGFEPGWREQMASELAALS